MNAQPSRSVPPPAGCPAGTILCSPGIHSGAAYYDALMALGDKYRGVPLASVKKAKAKASPKKKANVKSTAKPSIGAKKVAAFVAARTVTRSKAKPKKK